MAGQENHHPHHEPKLKLKHKVKEIKHETKAESREAAEEEDDEMDDQVIIDDDEDDYEDPYPERNEEDGDDGEDGDEKGEPEEGVEPGDELTEEEIARYDRQIRLWGIEAQQRIMSTTVWVFGIDTITMEAAKNLAAAGLNLITVDDRPYSGQMVSVIPKEDMFAPRPTVGKWFEESLRQMNDYIVLDTAPETFQDHPQNVDYNWAIGNAGHPALNDPRWKFDHHLVYSITPEVIEIWCARQDESTRKPLDEELSEGLEPSESAIIGAFISQCLTNQIADALDRPLGWVKINYDRAKMCAHTIYAPGRGNNKPTTQSDAVEID